MKQSGPIKEQSYALNQISENSRKRGTRNSSKGMIFCEKCGKVMTRGQYTQHKSRCQGKSKEDK